MAAAPAPPSWRRHVDQFLARLNPGVAPGCVAAQLTPAQMQPFGLPPPNYDGVKICFANFTGFRSNWGCQATSFELFKLTLRAFEGRTPPHITFTPLLEASPLDEQLDASIDDIHAAIADAAQQNANPASIQFLEDICERRCAPWTAAARSADVLVFQAEGSLSGRVNFCDGIGVFLLPFVAKRAWGKRIISLNQTIYSGHARQIDALRAAMSVFDIAAVREGSSVEFARAHAIPVSYIPDAAFLTKPGPSEHLPTFSSSQRYFGVTGSALKEPDKAEQTIDLADRIRSMTGRLPVLVASSDKSVINLAEKRWKRGEYIFVPADTSYPGVARALQHCDFLIGGRYHMAILAAAAGTPTLLTRGNSPKNEGLAAMLQSRFPVRALTESDDILADAKALCEDLPAIKAELAAAIEKIAQEIRRAEGKIGAALLSESVQPLFLSALPTMASANNAYYATVADRKAKPKSWSSPQPISTKLALSALLQSYPNKTCSDEAVQQWFDSARSTA